MRLRIGQKVIVVATRREYIVSELNPSGTVTIKPIDGGPATWVRREQLARSRMTDDQRRIKKNAGRREGRKIRKLDRQAQKQAVLS